MRIVPKTGVVPILVARIYDDHFIEDTCGFFHALKTTDR